MKNILAENMLRFGTKNLTESTKQQLMEATAMTGSLPATKNQPLPVRNPISAKQPLPVIPLSKPETIIANQEDQTINTNTQSSVLQNLQLQSDVIRSQIESIRSIQDEQKQLLTLQTQKLATDEFSGSGGSYGGGGGRSGGGGNGGDGGGGDGASKVNNWVQALTNVLGLIGAVTLVFKKDPPAAGADAGAGDN